MHGRGRENVCGGPGPAMPSRDSETFSIVWLTEALGKSTFCRISRDAELHIELSTGKSRHA